MIKLNKTYKDRSGNDVRITYVDSCSRIMKPELNEGEIYVGRINDEHIILLPGDKDHTTWDNAMDWAKKAGGDLPNRIEQFMLWVGFEDQFQQDWYWSNETHHVYEDSAWFQDFYDGYQDGSPKDLILCRARAVRRVKIGE